MKRKDIFNSILPEDAENQSGETIYIMKNIKGSIVKMRVVDFEIIVGTKIKENLFDYITYTNWHMDDIVEIKRLPRGITSKELNIIQLAIKIIKLGHGNDTIDSLMIAKGMATFISKKGFKIALEYPNDFFVGLEGYYNREGVNELVATA